MKTQSLNTRLTPDDKALLERAAEISGRSLSDFVISNAKKRARQVIEDHQRVLASKRDQEVFFDAILNPTPPSDAVKSGVQDFKNWTNDTTEIHPSR